MKRAGDVLKNFFEGIGIHDEKNYAGFFHSWKDIIGQELFTHCRAIDIRGEVLIVAVDHPGWMSRAQFKERDVLRAIKKKFPQLGLATIAYTLVDKLPDLREPLSPDTQETYNQTDSEKKQYSNEEIVDNRVITVDKNFPRAPDGAHALKAALDRLKESINDKQKRDKSS